METTILENYLKRTDQMLGTIFGLMGRIDEKIDDALIFYFNKHIVLMLFFLMCFERALDSSLC